MTKNDVLRRFRYALDINDSTMIEIFGLAGYRIDKNTLSALFKKEENDGYLECSDAVMTSFLDGLILYKRGKQEGVEQPQEQQDFSVNNNVILKKMRIALELNEEGMLAIMKLADVTVSKSELSALFRRIGHKNYKECGDQFLRNFLNGLTRSYRKDSFTE